jgi:hypothetical protein
MKTNFNFVALVAAYFALNSSSSSVRAQGTAFTYQGRLNDSGAPATGSYDLQFSLYASAANGALIAGPLNNPATGVTNGLFTVTLDFGNQFPGTDRWLEIAVRTNGGGGFSTLAPRQKLTPAPYAIFAGGANSAGLSGPVGNGQLANNSVTVNAGPGLSGGGPVALGGMTTLTNSGVLSVAGSANGDITATTLPGGIVALGDTATSSDIPNTIVKRDSSGSFAATNITLDGNLYLPATTATTGIIYGGGGTLLDAYGTGNIFAGPGAGNLTLTGNFNTATGDNALHSDVDGFENTADGAQTLLFNTSGVDNTATGFSALFSNTSGSYNIAEGAYALVLNTTGSNNIASGYEALYHNSSGYYNTAIGFEPMWENVSGYQNIAIGFQPLFDNFSGHENIAIGIASLHDNISGQGNTAVGLNALLRNDGDFNTAVGTSALETLGTGDAMGHGTNNIALGWFAGNGLEIGNNNIYIGSGGGGFDSGVIRIGSPGLQTATFIAGIFGPAPAGLPVYVGSGGQLGTEPSSARFKQDIHSMEDASDVLLSLRPVTFHYKPKFDPHGTAQFGLVAEEVNKVDPDLVVHDGKGEAYGVRYEAVNAMLLNEFLKQHRKVEEQESRIQNESAEITELKQRLATLEQILLKQK